MNKRLLVIPLLVVVVTASAFVERQRQAQRSTLSGFFENQPVQVASRIQGRVVRLDVREGQVVKKGQTLVVLEAEALASDAAATRASAEQATERYAETRNGPRPEDIRRQRAVVAELEANLRRLQAGSRPEEIAQARAAEAHARARLAQARRGLTREERAQLQARLDTATTEAAFARRDADRYTQLYGQGYVTRQEWERKQADARRTAAQREDAAEAVRRAQAGTPAEEMEQARQAWLQASAALDLALAGSRREDVDAARARLDQARAQLDELVAGTRREQIEQARAAAASADASARSARIRLDERTVTSPVDGVVERVPVSVGDLVSAGTTLVRMADPNDIWVRVYVPEDHLHALQVGTPASLAVDGVTARMQAHVESISTQGEFTPANLQIPEERGRQVFGVRLRLDRPDPAVKAGMFATVKQLGSWVP